MSRAMRRPCSRMMARNRSRALASSRAEPCSVSMKPSSEASGVRNSWLALAMKSTRMRSTRLQLGQIAQREQRRHDFSVGRGERRDAHVEQPLDRHPFAPLHPFGLAARHHPPAGVEDIGRPQGEDERLADFERRQQIERRRVGGGRAPVRPDDDRRLRHGLDELGRERRPDELGELNGLRVAHRKLRLLVRRRRHGFADRAPAPRRFDARRAAPSRR